MSMKVPTKIDIQGSVCANPFQKIKLVNSFMETQMSFLEKEVDASLIEASK